MVRKEYETSDNATLEAYRRKGKNVSEMYGNGMTQKGGNGELGMISNWYPNGFIGSSSKWLKVKHIELIWGFTT